jgi:hypothetical protein
MNFLFLKVNGGWYYPNKAYHVRKTGQRKKMAVFWVVAPCSVVEVYRRFRGRCCLHHQGDIVVFDYIISSP